MHETAWWSSWQGAIVIGLLLLIAGLLIWLIVRSREAAAGGSPRGGQSDDEAVALVRMRYARGELDREGFNRIVQDLTGRPRVIAERSEPPEPPESSAQPASPTTEPA